MVEGTVVACEPPRLLAFEWGESIVRWELAPTDGGCQLVFSQDGMNPWWFLGAAAGWKGFIEDVVSLVQDGEGIEEPQATHQHEWERYKAAYGPFVPGFDVRPALRHPEAAAYVTRAEGGRYNVRYVRRMMLPIAKVWAAITEADG